MSGLAGSKRSASTPFASPSKAASKRSRIKYDYGDDDGTESSQEDQWSAGDADSMSFDSEDDIRDFMPSPLGDFMSTSSDDVDDYMGCEARYRENLRTTEIPQNAVHPLSVASTNCRCNASNLKTSCVTCACSRWGYRCKAEICGCHGGPLCHNPFNQVNIQSIFGPGPVTLNECFITWVLKQRKVRTEQINTGFLFELALQYSHRIKDVTDYLEPYLEWRTKWDALPVSEQGSRVELQQEMNRMAFTKQHSPMNVFFSFCSRHDHWEGAENTWHCRVCGECREGSEWHCTQCNKCSGASSIHCDGCGRIATSLHTDFLENDEF